MGSALLAATPLGAILLAMVVFRRSAVLSGTVGLVLALTLMLTAFQPPDGAVATLTRGVGAEALHATATILWIILPALALYEFQKASGAVLRIRDRLASLTEDRRLQAILIAWFFGLFMEGAAGFGTPVALAAPLLVGLGYAPVRAVVLALLGHAAGVSFGAVGTPVLAQVELSGLNGQEIALRTAALHAVCGSVLLLSMVRLAGPSRLSRRDLLWTGLAAACFFLPSLLFARLIGPELPTLGGAIVGSVLFIGLLSVKTRPSANARGSLFADLAPYVLTVLFVLASRLLPTVGDALQTVTLRWSLDGTFAGTFQPLYHPGTMMVLGLLAGSIATGRGALLLPALAAAIGRLLPVALALLVMLALSRLMVHAGMIDVLATAAASVGSAWPFLAPSVGILGTFITGSATASNILFTDLQITTASSLGLPVVLMSAAQGFGAAIGNVVAPHNIIAGSATVGLSGREGEILARTIRPCFFYAALGGCAVYLALQIS